MCVGTDPRAPGSTGTAAGLLLLTQPRAGTEQSSALGVERSCSLVSVDVTFGYKIKEKASMGHGLFTTQALEPQVPLKQCVHFCQFHFLYVYKHFLYEGTSNTSNRKSELKYLRAVRVLPSPPPHFLSFGPCPMAPPARH